MTTASQEFAARMAMAILPHTGTGVHFNLGTQYNFAASENAGPNQCFGRLSFLVLLAQSRFATVHIRYKLDGSGDGETWTQGFCTLTVQGWDDRWEFYCSFTDGVMTAEPTATTVKRAELREAVRERLSCLGLTPYAIGVRLSEMGFNMDVAGLVQYLREIFGLNEASIVLADHNGLSRPEIHGSRAGSDIELRLYDHLSPGLLAFIHRDLVPA